MTVLTLPNVLLECPMINKLTLRLTPQRTLHGHFNHRFQGLEMQTFAKCQHLTVLQLRHNDCLSTHAARLVLILARILVLKIVHGHLAHDLMQ